MLILAYKRLMPQLGGYLTDAGRVHLPRTEVLLREVSSYEDETFERARGRERGRAAAPHKRQSRVGRDLRARAPARGGARARRGGAQGCQRGRRRGGRLWRPLPAQGEAAAGAARRGRGVCVSRIED